MISMVQQIEQLRTHQRHVWLQATTNEGCPNLLSFMEVLSLYVLQWSHSYHQPVGILLAALTDFSGLLFLCPTSCALSVCPQCAL